MIYLTIFLNKINTNLLVYNQSGTKDFVDKSLQNLFTYELTRTINNNYALVLKNNQNETVSFSTGSVGWNINSEDSVGYALSLDGTKIVFNIPDYLLQGFI